MNWLFTFCNDTFPFTIKSPLIDVSPFTSNLYSGLVLPIPTYPAGVIRIRSVIVALPVPYPVFDENNICPEPAASSMTEIEFVGSPLASMNDERFIFIRFVP